MDTNASRPAPARDRAHAASRANAATALAGHATTDRARREWLAVADAFKAAATQDDAHVTEAVDYADAAYSLAWRLHG